MRRVWFYIWTSTNTVLSLLLISPDGFLALRSVAVCPCTGFGLRAHSSVIVRTLTLKHQSKQHVLCTMHPCSPTRSQTSTHSMSRTTKQVQNPVYSLCGGRTTCERTCDASLTLIKFVHLINAYYIAFKSRCVSKGDLLYSGSGDKR